MRISASSWVRSILSGVLKSASYHEGSKPNPTHTLYIYLQEYMNIMGSWAGFFLLRRLSSLVITAKKLALEANELVLCGCSGVLSLLTRDRMDIIPSQPVPEALRITGGVKRDIYFKVLPTKLLREGAQDQSRCKIMCFCVKHCIFHLQGSWSGPEISVSAPAADLKDSPTAAHYSIQL